MSSQEFSANFKAKVLPNLIKGHISALEKVDSIGAQPSHMSPGISELCQGLHALLQIEKMLGGGGGNAGASVSRPSSSSGTTGVTAPRPGSSNGTTGGTAARPVVARPPPAGR